MLCSTFNSIKTIVIFSIFFFTFSSKNFYPCSFFKFFKATLIHIEQNKNCHFDFKICRYEELGFGFVLDRLSFFVLIQLKPDFMLVFGIYTTLEYRFCLAQKVGGGIFLLLNLNCISTGQKSRHMRQWFKMFTIHIYLHLNVINLIEDSFMHENTPSVS